MIKILIVDDDEKLVKLMETFLSGEGYEVLTAGDSSAALRMTAAHNPDLVLLDKYRRGSSPY